MSGAHDHWRSSRSNRFASKSSAAVISSCGSLPSLPVEVRIIESIHAALKCHRGIRAIKELRGYTQSTDPVASSPRGTNLISLASACRRPGELP
jgi:hypothetical protein